MSKDASKKTPSVSVSPDPEVDKDSAAAPGLDAAPADEASSAGALVDHSPGSASEMGTLDGVPSSLWEDLAKSQGGPGGRSAAKAPAATPAAHGTWLPDDSDESSGDDLPVLPSPGPLKQASIRGFPDRSTAGEDLTRIGLDEARRRLAAGASFSFADGRYEIRGELGRGGMGVVYEALQLDLNRLVALKVMLQGAFATDHQVRRFIREAESAGRLKHPRIVRVLDIGAHGGFTYFTMEWVDGLDLSDYYRARKLGWKESARLVASVASGVAYAHTQGIIHRDLKPANILIDKEGRAHILDFGLAKVTDSPDSASGASVRAGRGLEGNSGSSDAKAAGALLGQETMEDAEAEASTVVEDEPSSGAEQEAAEKKLADRTASLTRTGTLVGTPHYMSPEQAHGRAHDVDVRSDVYALGVILYELTTRRLPFDGESVHEVLYAIMKQEPRPPRTIVKGMPRELDAIVLKAMEKQKERRYQNAQELEADLTRFCRGESVLARPPGPLRRALRFARQHSVATAMLLTALTAVIALGAWSVGNRRIRIADLHRQLTAEITVGMDSAHDLGARKLSLQSVRQSYGLLVDLAPAQEETRSFNKDLTDLERAIQVAEKLADSEKHTRAGEAELAKAREFLKAVIMEEAFVPLREAQAQFRQALELNGKNQQAFDGNTEAGRLTEKLRKDLSLRRTHTEASGHLQAGVRVLQASLVGLLEELPGDGAAARYVGGWQDYLASLAASRSLSVLVGLPPGYGLDDEPFPSELLASQERRSVLTDQLREVLKELDLGLSKVPGGTALRLLRIDAAVLLARVALEDRQHVFAEFVLAPLDRLAAEQDLRHKAIINAVREEVARDRAGYERYLDLVLTGRQAFDQGLWEEAARKLGEALELNPEDAETRKRLRDSRREKHRAMARKLLAMEPPGHGPARAELEAGLRWCNSDNQRSQLEAELTACLEAGYQAALLRAQQQASAGGRRLVLAALDEADTFKPGTLEVARLRSRLSGEARTPEGMVFIPAVSERQLGSDQPEDRHPPHLVDLEGFALAKREVTNADFAVFVAAGGYDVQRAVRWWDPEGLRLLRSRAFLEQVTGRSGPAGFKAGRHRNGEGLRPVTGVSFYEARAYARWLGDVRGGAEQYRLPFEDEWEAAARFGGRDFPCGDPPPPALAKRTDLYDVGTAPEDMNALGLSDLTANASEWAVRRRHQSAGQEQETSSTQCVVRGGSSLFPFEDEWRAARRSLPDPVFRGSNVGFRLACTVARESDASDSD